MRRNSSSVDLRSDTVTRPVAGMRRAIAEAEVGDDALGDDPTVRALERRVAELLRKESALFFPSGIMANQVALMVLGQPGTEVVCEATSHIFDWELAGAASNANLQLRTVLTPDGTLTPELVARAIRPRAATLQVQTSMVSVENTHNAAGGRIMPLDIMRDIHQVAADHGLPVHLDGARLWNASAASGATEAEYADCADTVMVTLSKGLGCPVGSMLAGSAEHVGQARVVRRRLGGSMRQAGILAAAGLYALEHHRSRLQDDHERARDLARRTAGIDGLRVVEPETNIVMFDLVRPDLDAADVLARLEGQGVLLSGFTARRIRAVTHLDVDDAGIARAADALSSALT